MSGSRTTLTFRVRPTTYPPKMSGGGGNNN
jgi:hypothetical protein